MIIKILISFLAIIAAAILITLVTSFVCYMKVFYSAPRKNRSEDDFALPAGKVYEPFYDDMKKWIKETRALPHEDISIKSRDGLTLRGSYYETKPGATLEILFHGYQGNGERDLSAGVERCFSMNRNALIIDQRAHGRSDGKTTTFGIKERFDCIDWVNYCIEKFGSDTKIIITGVSMGAATVMMAAGEELPKNVVCVLADCGYTSAKDIIKKVIREMKLPDNILYPFVKLGADIFGGFNLEEASPIEAVKRAKVPIIFIHGDTDDFVPHSMSAELYEACLAPHKKFTTIEGAGHGLAFPVNKEHYYSALYEFERECGF